MKTLAVEKLRDNIGRVFIGNPAAIDRVICCLLARGHLLIEDVPGVGKTVLATAMARSIDGVFSRLQLTPDLLPSDVLGVSIYDQNTGKFEYRRGPIFANIVLADEINRTTPRTQSALLESMNEATVSVDGKTFQLDRPFMVIATQNPYEFEGTYPLPENQLDRFLMQISLGYPSPEDEARVLSERPGDSALHSLVPVMTPLEVVAIQDEVDRIRLDGSLIQYIISIATALREHADLQVGLSPRGSLALAQASRASALLHERDYVIPEDILNNAVPVCAHRLIPRSGLHVPSAHVTRDIVLSVLKTVPSPA